MVNKQIFVECKNCRKKFYTYYLRPRKTCSEKCWHELSGKSLTITYQKYPEIVKKTQRKLKKLY